ncbi:three prime repair exonuclease 2-like [Contarinia nasturtii]|uniref:three prime repair exonuclease 2-like n=1 Tax=Contarinia nasturtii TaxID=265458 RepID=UPI0012D41ED6|nr:three prime repair exonuclease 2-like [Contarinia nasturtii]
MEQTEKQWPHKHFRFFFDIETTGFPNKTNPPKITEITFIACSKDDLLKTPKGSVPRVLHKLSPIMKPIKGIVTNLTGLSNELLDHVKPMDNNTITLFGSYFNRLNKPICLVAHNGYYFDYPILKAHLRDLYIILLREVVKFISSSDSHFELVPLFREEKQ